MHELRDHLFWAHRDVRHDGTITCYGIAEDHLTRARPNIHALDAGRWGEVSVAWLGTQGWELIAVAEGAGSTFYLKCTIEERSATLEIQVSGMETTGVSVTNEKVLLEDTANTLTINPVRLINEEFLGD